MDWLDEADKQLQRFKDRERIISEHEGEIYDSLWEELKRHVDAAREREAFAAIETNGKPESRVIFIPRVDRQPYSFPTFTRQVTISLLRDKHQVVAEIADPNYGGVHSTETFHIDVKRDGVLCLMRNGKVRIGPGLTEQSLQIPRTRI